MKEYIEIELEKEELEDLEILKSSEQAYLDSGEVLLEACLKLPFKNKEKVDSLIEKIAIHKNNVTRIGRVIYDKKTPLYNDGVAVWGHSTLTSGSWNVVAGHGYCQSSNINIIKVKYMKDSTDIKDYMVIDDIFKSELGNYYLMMPDGTPLDLNRIIEIDEDSNVGKWYGEMCQKFVREAKLKRISK